MKFLAALALTTCLISAADAQNAGVLEKVRDAIEAGDRQALALQLNSVKEDHPDVFAANDLDYLLGRTLEQMGDAAGAMENFESTRRRDPVLRPYALWHLASLARSSGDLFLERLYLNELAAFGAESLPSGAARGRLPDSYLESGDHASAIGLLENGYGSGTSAAAGRNTADRERHRRSQLANAYLLAGEKSRALSLFSELIGSSRNAEQPDDVALDAARGLDAIEADPTSASVLTDREHFDRASVYYFNRDFENARAHYLTILDSFPSSPLAARSVFQIGRAFAQERNFVEAVKWFEREQEQSADETVIKDSLLQSASAYSRLGKYRESIARYQKFIAAYPSDEAVERCYLNIVDALRDEGEEVAAVQQAQKVQELFRGRQAEALAIFSEARLYISRNDWQNAIDALGKLEQRRDLGGAAAAGGTNTAEVTFLKAYSLEQLSRYAEAVDAYLSIADGPGSYYGGMATSHLRDLARAAASRAAVENKLAALTTELQTAPDPARKRSVAAAAFRLSASDEAGKPFSEILRQAYSKLPEYARLSKLTMLDAGRREVLSKPPRNANAYGHQAAAGQLLFLGLYDEAAPEYEASLLADRSDRVGAGTPQKLPADAAYTLAELYRRGDRGDRAASLFAQVSGRGGEIQPELADPQFAKFDYPAPYVGSLKRAADVTGVDPRFLLAIIRQESGFRPNVKSNASARGLMQFIPSTAELTARGAGLTAFRDDDLYDPNVSITLGGRYVSELFKLFPDLPEAVAASYNGGEDNMKRWLSRSKSRVPERYVAEIAYGQSKDYVYRVMSNYRMYRLLYDRGLELKRPPLSDD